MQSRRGRRSLADPRSRLRRPTLVGILNVTPDSFSDGGNFLSLTEAVGRASQMVDEGADVIEVGGESTRPGATPVTEDEELGRVLPVIRAILSRLPTARVAIDTVKSAVAAEALLAGVSMVNDVSGLRLDPAIAQLCAARDATLVVMHSRGAVADMATYTHAEYPDNEPVSVIVDELRAATRRAIAAGVAPHRIVIDPGLGFAKRPEHSVQVLANLPRLLELGFQTMVGASRKRFIGGLTGVTEASHRTAGTIGANVVALALGATWFRVHDVLENRHALDVAHAILEARA